MAQNLVSERPHYIKVSTQCTILQSCPRVQRLIYLVRRGGRKHILLDRAVLLPWCKKTAGVVSGRCGSNVYVCQYMENAIAVLCQIEEIS